MSERKRYSRTSIILAAALGGGLLAATVGQRMSDWVLSSQTHTILVVGLSAVICGAIAWLATLRASTPRSR